MKELKPALRFLAIFLVLYLGLNVLYGIWISSYGSEPDYITYRVTEQTSAIVNLLGEETTVIPNPARPAVVIQVGLRSALNVYEGCNGLNVMIVFIAFVIAFGGSRKNLAWFIPLGVILIYGANLGRVTALYYVAEYWKHYFYYIHKYAFTGIIYLFVFVLWWWWIEKINGVSLRRALQTKNGE
jgi:exosortase family protein XrtF